VSPCLPRPGRPARPALLALLVAGLSFGCAGSGDDPDPPGDGGVPLVTLLAYQQAGDSWRRLDDGDLLDMELGFQGLMMLPIALRARDLSGDLGVPVADFDVRLLDTGVELAHLEGSPQPFVPGTDGLYEAETTYRIASLNDLEALHGRTVELEVTLASEGHGLGGGEPTTIRRILELNDPVTDAACKYPNAPIVPPSPLFVDVPDATNLAGDHVPFNSSPDCLLPDAPGGPLTQTARGLPAASILASIRDRPTRRRLSGTVSRAGRTGVEWEAFGGIGPGGGSPGGAS